MMEPYSDVQARCTLIRLVFDLPSAAVWRVAERFELIHYEDGETIGSPHDTGVFHIIAEGTARKVSEKVPLPSFPESINENPGIL